jgi:hypothetical protein
VPRCLILLTKHELNIQTPYRTSFTITVAKTPFSSSLLISLRRESINRASYIRTNISVGCDGSYGSSPDLRTAVTRTLYQA